MEAPATEMLQGEASSHRPALPVEHAQPNPAPSTPIMEEPSMPVPLPADSSQQAAPPPLFPGDTPELPPPPPPPPLPPPARNGAHDPAAPHTPGQSPQREPRPAKLPQDFQHIFVDGDAPPQPKPKKPSVKKPVDAHLPAAKLRIFCFDRTTGEPITGVSVHINTLSNVNDGKAKNIANAFGNIAYSRSDGVCLLKLLAGYPYVITATCEGYHKFGELGEYLLITPKDDEKIEKAIGMVPIRISVVVTLRELRPLAGRTMQFDPHGQVNPVYVPPTVDKMSVQPQKVAFTTPDGAKQTFLAMTLMARNTLQVIGDVPQPAALAQAQSTAIQAQLLADQQAAAASDTRRGLAGKRDGSAHAPPTRPAVSRAGVAGGSGGDQSAGQESSQNGLGGAGALGTESSSMTLYSPDGKMCVYSTDSEGHCFFYGPRIDAGRRGGLVREFHYFDAGRWEYTAKYHLIRNMLSPTLALFEDQPLKPLGVRSRSPSPQRTSAAQAKLDAWLANNPDVAGMLAPPSAPRRGRPLSAGGRPQTAPIGGRKQLPALEFGASAGKPGSSFKRGWLGVHPEIQDMIQPPAGDPMLAGRTSGVRRSAGVTGGTMSSFQPRSQGGAAHEDADGLEYDVDGPPPPGSNALLSPSAAMGTMPMDPEGVHNYLHPGVYDVRVQLPSHLLIFYTYTGDKEMAEVSKAQNSLVQLTMHDIEPSHMAPKVEGTPEKRTTYPVQLYCRARPWLQIVVYDTDTLEDVGALYGLQYKVQRLDYSRSLKYRVARMKAILEAANTQDPAAIPDEDNDAEAMAYITKQEKRSKLAGLWAKAEVQELERSGADAALELPARTDPSSSTTAKAMDDEEDSLYVPHASGELADDAQRLWVTPGEKYAVTVSVTSPFLELAVRQTRTMGWELEPFVFYALRKVRLLVGLRERFNQQPIQGLKVHCTVEEYPRPPRPPIIRQEWCEAPNAYARRVLDQLIDHVVQSRSTAATANVAQQLVAESNNDGIATLMLPPQARVHLKVEVGENFEEADSEVVSTLTKEPEQFLGFQLERICYVHPSIIHAVTGAGLAGFTIKAYDITHLAPDAPKQGLSPKKAARRQRQEEEDREKLRDTTPLTGLEPFFVGVTNADGTLDPPITRRAGHVVKVVCANTPKDFLLPDYFQPGSGTVIVSTYDRHHIKFVCPPKPRVRVRAQDACTLEYVHGVRLRVMVRRIAPALVAEGETKSPQEIAQEEEDLAARAAEAAAQAAEEAAAAAKAAEETAAADARASSTAGAVPGTTPTPGTAAGAGGKSEVAGDAAQASADGTGMHDGAGTATGQASRAGGAMGAGAGQEGGEDEAEEDDIEGLNTLTNKNRVYWDGKPVPRGSGRLTSNPNPENDPRAHLAPGNTPPANDQELRDRVLDKLTDLAAPQPAQVGGEEAGGPGLGAYQSAGYGPPGFPHGSGQQPRVRMGRGKDEVGAWAAGESAAVTRGRSAGGARNSKPGTTGGFAYEPSDDGASQAGPAESVDSFAVAEAEARAEEAARAEEDAADELDPWGPVWYEAVTGSPELDVDGLGLMIDAGVEVAVQALPAWPYTMIPMQLTADVPTWQDPSVFEFMLPRDDGAFRFWMERDRVLHTFFDADGSPRLPYHPLARLQPLAPPTGLIARLHPGVRLLKPAHGAAPLDDKAHALVGGEQASGPADGADVTGASGQVAGQSKAGAGEGAGGGALGPSSYANGSPTTAGWAGGSGRPCGSGGGSDRPGRDAAPSGLPILEEFAEEEEEEGTLHEDPSAIQFTEGGEDLDDMRAAAWEHLRLADSQYLPLERTRLVALLAKWGAFPHLQGGACRACQGTAPSASSPFLMRPGAQHNHSHRHGKDMEDEGVEVVAEDDARTYTSGGHPQFKSALLNAGSLDLAAAWALDRPPGAFHRPNTPPHLSQHVPDKYARTHRIIARSEAVYCDTPFFTWRLTNGTALHVGVHELLYRELITLLDSTAKSLEFLEGHLAKARAHNETRGKHGRFLLGHKAVEGCRGGLFVLDVTDAQPFGGVTFMLDQLGATWDHWAEMAAAADKHGPLVNVMAAAGDKWELYRRDMFHVQGERNMDKLRGWYEEIRNKLPRVQGYKMPIALDAAFKHARARVPIYLLCGGMLPRVRDNPKKLSHTLYEAQLRCIETRSAMQPIHSVELYPMPKLKEGGSKGVAGASSRRTATTTEGGTGTTDDDGREDAAVEGGELEAAPSLSDVTVQGADIFEMLQEAMAVGRVRLVDVFREMDRDGTNYLDTQQLYALVQRFVPDVSPAHLRYLQLILDTDGNGRVSYKELATAMKAATRGGVRLQLRDQIEVNMLLQRVALLMMLESKTTREFFDSWDMSRDGYLDQVEQWRMLKGVFPGLTVDEQRELFAALQGVDLNSDERISFDEWERAFRAGGVQQLQAWGAARDPEELKAMKAGAGGGPDEITMMGARAEQEHAELKLVRAAGFPLHAVLVKVSGMTRGRVRRLDLGHARAAAEPIDLAPLEHQQSLLQRSLEGLRAFEAAYGTQLTLARSSRPDRPLVPGPGGGGGALTAVEPPSASAVASKARGVSGAELGRLATRAERAKQEAAYGSPANTSGKKTKARAASTGRRRSTRPSTASPGGTGPSDALLANTTGREQYVSDMALRRSAPAAALLAAVPRWSPAASGAATPPTGTPTRPLSRSGSRSSSRTAGAAAATTLASIPAASPTQESGELGPWGDGSASAGNTPPAAADTATPGSLRRRPRPASASPAATAGAAAVPPPPVDVGPPTPGASSAFDGRQLVSPPVRTSSPGTRPGSAPHPRGSASSLNPALSPRLQQGKPAAPPPASRTRHSIPLGSPLIPFIEPDGMDSPLSVGSLRTTRRTGPAGFRASMTQNVRNSDPAGVAWNP